jgi:hypothetical protein
MKLAREETKIKVTGRRFYRKNNLKFRVGTGTGTGAGTGAGTGTVDKKFGTWNRNRNLGKMARFRNTGTYNLESSQ